LKVLLSGRSEETVTLEPDVTLEPESSWLLRRGVDVLRLVPGMGSTSLSSPVRLALRGSTWTLVGYGGSQLLRFAAQIALAHVLAPTAFGAVALAIVFLSGLELLSDLGIGMDVIQHPRGDDPAFVNTAFIIQAVRGSILFVIAALLAHPFAIFYRMPQVEFLAIVAALSILIRGFASGSIWTLTRHVKIRELTLLTITGEVVGLAVSLIWVYVSPTAWALVIGRVASSIIYTSGSHFLGEGKFGLQWDRVAAKEILAFGAGIFLSSATYFMSGEAERLIVGKCITIAELGCFSLALTMASAPAQALSQVVGQVFYPIISRSTRESPEIATRHFVKAVFLLISIALTVLFIVGGPMIVSILLPPKYEMTGWMLQWLGFRAAQQVFVAPTTSLLFAHGNTKYAATYNIMRFILMTIGLWVAFTRFGIHLALAMLALSSVLPYVFLIPGVLRYQPRAARAELLSFASFLAISALAACVRLPHF
jgi:O-antigen/teichoic acid export membrane protein